MNLFVFPFPEFTRRQNGTGPPSGSVLTAFPLTQKYFYQHCTEILFHVEQKYHFNNKQHTFWNLAQNLTFVAPLIFIQHPTKFWRAATIKVRNHITLKTFHSTEEKFRNSNLDINISNAPLLFMDHICFWQYFHTNARLYNIWSLLCPKILQCKITSWYCFAILYQSHFLHIISTISGVTRFWWLYLVFLSLFLSLLLSLSLSLSLSSCFRRHSIPSLLRIIKYW